MGTQWALSVWKSGLLLFQEIITLENNINSRSIPWFFGFFFSETSVGLILVLLYLLSLLLSLWSSLLFSLCLIFFIPFISVLYYAYCIFGHICSFLDTCYSFLRQCCFFFNLFLQFGQFPFYIFLLFFNFYSEFLNMWFVVFINT